ncbi:hypothetical protein PWEIH_00110 [Listeria weihenstephanensis FSL R9-0317]|uniref:Uncharacterized protein n=1 Tax=Listeria weihenstephanensis TaxID=1006155 RepID=A0A1S7FSL0_9LIST|nr:hypothetical protein [Listeria weihenstephanensis]AQY50414.1 hypothetical protein UE46_04810 [Listeria weihenstephanensis]EUJ41424.1 hypothetical protein PWEIH_00110 [Listeria weihenstephanensis FSL R9-0317]MBC1501601.1 hypothetical protein [Listeria weihenstephanensis]
MAKSNAQKQREKWIREGKLDPRVKRSPFASFDLRSKTTKTKQERINQKKYKHSYSNEERENAYIFYLYGI